MMTGTEINDLRAKLVATRQIDKAGLAAFAEELEQKKADAGAILFLRSILGSLPDSGKATDHEIPVEVSGMDGQGVRRDHRGYRLDKPPRAADRAMFETSIGIPRRRIRNLGN